VEPNTALLAKAQLLCDAKRGSGGKHHYCHREQKLVGVHPPALSEACIPCGRI
jgi:hypothetical protein